MLKMKTLFMEFFFDGMITHSLISLRLGLYQRFAERSGGAYNERGNDEYSTDDKAKGHWVVLKCPNKSVSFPSVPIPSHHAHN